jgi:16S rRNA (cytosine967-C5)-methyltransferase
MAKGLSTSGVANGPTQGAASGTASGTARSAAIALLNAVLGEGMLLSQALAEDAGFLAGMGPADRARAQRLVLAVLRQLEPVDAVLKPLLRKAPPLEVVNILRLAVVEIKAGAAMHGVVNTAVNQTRKGNRTQHMAGLVNAVLRQIDETPLQGPPQRLPRWMRQPLVHRYGRDAVSAIEAVQAQVPPMDLTRHPGREMDPALLGAVVLPTGSWRLAAAGQVSALPGYATGDWWVQDAGAALAVPLLGVKPQQRVLDLCAAPGGKTMQLAAAGAQVVAVDISGPRMARVAQNLARTGLTASLVVADALNWEPDALFDAILLDAPCSATGTLRRHPDLPFVKDDSDVAMLVTLQAQLLDRALGWLKPGGRLVFCTCSLMAEEGEDQLTAALARHRGLAVVPAALPGVPADWVTPQGALRLRPDFWAEQGGVDGFFMVCLTRELPGDNAA